MLRMDNVEVKFLGAILVLRGVSLEVESGRITALLGANGAGKTTTLRAISGLLRMEEGAVTAGSIHYDGHRIDRMAPEDIARLGIVQVWEGRRVFQHLTVEQNLNAGATFRTDSAAVRKDLSRVYDYFPRLSELRTQVSGYISGGEQQMLVIGRALMARPRLLLLDEPSLGLAPLVVKEIFAITRRIVEEEQMTVLLVEQNARAALGIASHGYVMENGRIVLDGPAADLRQNRDIQEFYLGLSEMGRKRSYKDVKHYKRRKRWLG